MTKQERNKLIYARYAEGYIQADLGKFYGLSQSAISLIIRSEKAGIPKNQKETRGAKSKLSDDDLTQLSSLLKSEQLKEGFSGWNKWSIKELIAQEFGVSYHENYVFELMRKIGYTSQLPAKKDYRQNPDQVAHFKTSKVIEIKKDEPRRA